MTPSFCVAPGEHLMFIRVNIDVNQGEHKRYTRRSKGAFQEGQGRAVRLWCLQPYRTSSVQGPYTQYESCAVVESYWVFALFSQSTREASAAARRDPAGALPGPPERVGRACRTG